MPNHFHLMVYVRKIEIPHQATPSHLMSQNKMTPSQFNPKPQTFNQSISVMLRSYTRAVNKEQKMSGSLFRQKTKAECINCPKGITPSFITKSGITKINIKSPEKQYPQICFNYIHQNPVKAGLAALTTNWEFSSAKDYAGLRNGSLVNIEKAKANLLI